MPDSKRIYTARNSTGALKAYGGWAALAAFALAYACGVVVRLLEAGKWSSPAFFAGGERILATHDAYAYLAGAKGVSRYADSFLSNMLAFLHSVAGAPLGDVGFWLPALMAPLAALPVCVVAGRLRRPEAGLFAGAWTVVMGGYLLRTRIGYLDTDVYSLFFAAGTAAGMFLWLRSVCRHTLIPALGDPSPENASIPKFWFWAVALGLFLRLYMAAYASGRPIAWAVLGTGALAGLALARSGDRMPLVTGMAMIVAVWNYGWLGVTGALAVIVAGAYDMRLVRRYNAVPLLALAFFIYFAASRGAGEFDSIIRLARNYLKFGGAVDPAAVQESSLNLPSVMQSVREAVNLSWAQRTQVMAGHEVWFWAGLLGAAFAVLRHPLLVVFLPLLGLALASSKFGVRFTMYGGPLFGLGLGLAISDLMSRRSRALRWVLQSALTAGVVFIFAGQLQDRLPGPVLSQPFAMTLLDLRDKSPKEAVLWQWWDYGYAAQYYAERDTFADGGRQTGEYLYPLALAHTTSSPMQAAQVITLMAAERQKQIKAILDQGGGPSVDAELDFYSVSPMQSFMNRPACQARVFFDSLRRSEYAPNIAVPERYFVVSWDNLMLSKWISRFGTWSLAEGETKGGKLFSPPGRSTEFDLQRGLMLLDGRVYSLSGMILVMEDGSARRHAWPGGGEAYCVASRMTGQIYVMDATIFESMMVRMLLDDPAEFGEHFELVVDRSPWARAYRVK